jgi:hypothetical protein
VSASPHLVEDGLGCRGNLVENCWRPTHDNLYSDAPMKTAKRVADTAQEDTR